MDLLRWMGVTFARFVGLVVLILGGWTFAVNVTDIDYEGLILVWILASGLVGALGGLFYLLSWDGPERFRKQRIRLWSWVAMVVASLLPTSLTLMIFPMVVVVSPMLPYAAVTSE